MYLVVLRVPSRSSTLLLLVVIPAAGPITIVTPVFKFTWVNVLTFSGMLVVHMLLLVGILLFRIGSMICKIGPEKKRYFPLPSSKHFYFK